jgi:hypothetical protein
MFGKTYFQQPRQSNFQIIKFSNLQINLRYSSSLIMESITCTLNRANSAGSK